MIEDMDAASAWLSLVSLRFVQRNAPPNRPVAFASNNEPESSNNRENLSSSIEGLGDGGSNKCYGYSGDVLIRRDTNGRLIVDLALNDAERDIILEAYNIMKNFEVPPLHNRDTSFEAPIAGRNSISKPSNNDNRCSNDFESLKNSLAFSSTPTIKYQSGEEVPRVIGVVELFGVAFNQGINEMQTVANMTGTKDIQEQAEININCMKKLSLYYERYRIAFIHQFSILEQKLISSLPNDKNLKFVRKDLLCNLDKLLSNSDKIKQEAEEAVTNASKSPSEKHVDVILKLNRLVRRIASTHGILCKSGKDRTGVGVTLEAARIIAEDIGVMGGSAIVQLLRLHGVRKMNVWANTGQDKFAFNTIQKMNLPPCYQPPAGTHAGSIKS
jgi:hypothetical protein